MEDNMKPTGKTLREMLSAVCFDDIVPFILADSHASMGHAQYKQAFDILLHTDGYEEGDWVVEVHRQSDSARRLDAYHLEGNPWELFIDSDIYLEEGPEVSDAEIAYALLWYMTFYGYDPESKQDTFHDMFSSDYCGTQYGRRAFQMEVRRDWVLGDRRIRKEIADSVREHEAEGYCEYCLGEAEWNYIHRHRRHCNGPKRKRDARMARRIDELVRMDRCEHTISRLLEGLSSFPGLDEQRLKLLCFLAWCVEMPSETVLQNLGYVLTMTQKETNESLNTLRDLGYIERQVSLSSKVVVSPKWYIKAMAVMCISHPEWKQKFSRITSLQYSAATRWTLILGILNGDADIIRRYRKSRQEEDFIANLDQYLSPLAFEPSFSSVIKSLATADFRRPSR